MLIWRLVWVTFVLALNVQYVRSITTWTWLGRNEADYLPVIWTASSNHEIQFVKNSSVFSIWTHDRAFTFELCWVSRVVTECSASIGIPWEKGVSHWTCHTALVVLHQESVSFPKRTLSPGFKHHSFGFHWSRVQQQIKFAVVPLLHFAALRLLWVMLEEWEGFVQSHRRDSAALS
jgi:hypothetical protein